MSEPTLPHHQLLFPLPFKRDFPRLLFYYGSASQECTKPDNNYMEMPVAVFRRTIEKQIEKDLLAVKESAHVAIPVPEETPATLPPSLAAILGSFLKKKSC